MWSPFSTTRKPYLTHSDIKDLTAEEIMRLSPSKVSSKIESNTGGVQLTKVQIQALNFLLALKRLEKDLHTPITKKQQDQMVQKRLNEMRLVDELITDTNTSIMRDKVSTKSMDNRLRRLNDKKEVSLTPEEQVFTSKIWAGRKTKKLHANKRQRRTHKRRTHTYKRTTRPRN